MKYGLVCGKVEWLIVIATMCVIFGITYALLRLTELGEETYPIRLSGKILMIIAVGSFLFAYRGVAKEYWIQGGWAYLVLSIYLLYCAVTDQMICKVYHFVQYPTVLSLVSLLIRNAYRRGAQGHWENRGMELIVFTLLQGGVFLKMYGKGDGLAFLMCALFFAARGSGLETMLCHMAVVFLLLTAAQAIRGNIAKNGDLKEKVALLPYIAVGFLMC